MANFFFNLLLPSKSETDTSGLVADRLGNSRLSWAKTGAEVQGLVLGKEGLLDLIAIGDKILKAKSETLLPEGATVKLQVVRTGAPLQVRLISVISPSVEENNGLERALLHLKAGISRLGRALGPVLHSESAVPKEIVLQGKAVTQAHSLIKDIALGANADSAKIEGAATLFQPDAESGNALIQKLANYVLKGDNPVDDVLRTITRHTQSVQQYQQQVQQHLDLPFFLIPLWFEKGAGFGHWAWWREYRESKDPDRRQGPSHLVFDLELKNLGPLKIHLKSEEKGLKLYVAAKEDILPTLRNGLPELIAALKDLGFRLELVDIFSIETADNSDLMGPMARTDCTLKSSMHFII